MIDQKKLNTYIDNHITKEGAFLNKLNRETNLKTLAPQMLSGHAQGNLLTILSRMLRPKYILEIGTFTGYSSLCLAKGLHEEGKLYTIEIKPDILHITKKYFEQSKHNHQIEIIIGDAKEEINNLDVVFDLAFIDADKVFYYDYYDLVIDKMRPGGIILADNVLWSGKVLEETSDPTTEAIKEFNKKISTDDRVQNIILPLRDGINLIQKL